MCLSVLALRGVGMGVLLCHRAPCTPRLPFASVTSSNTNWHHFLTSPNHLGFDINKNSKEFRESSFSVYCI